MAKRGFATVKIAGTKKVRDDLLKFVQQQTKDEGVLNTLGVLAAEQIRKRTRGKQDEAYKQKPLTPATIDRRKSLIKSGNQSTEKSARPSQSNLTLSGQLLNALTHKINQATGIVTIFLKRERQPYKGVNGKSLENKKDNIQIKKDLEERGRLFLFISERLNSQLRSKIRDALAKRLSLYRKIRSK